ncbi:ATP-dependent DNA helicase RecG [Labedaea rhizosphaerae]|uniref:ATP-dependent DNA helicase RecG n=1 Tax=Labedaea rhizosphaerae TaxID=598644 RepID=A0A4R6SBU5_LABRH|nr:ATP-dependent DNA helicase RecG [Labedaea rhizosphaerae]TDP97451.1 ATP-dependent DNA helicase RecG [Labedaea rhizosphaerae]
MATLDTKLETIIGRASAKALGGLDLNTVGELLRHYPRRYAERGELTDIAGLEVGEHVTVMARVSKASARSMRNRKGRILNVEITDGQRRLEVAFFNQYRLEGKLKVGVSALFAGKVTVFNNKLQLANPEVQLLENDDDESAVDDFLSGLIPVYPAAQKIQSWQVGRCIRQVLAVLDELPDPMPPSVRQRRKLRGYDEAVRLIHQPSSWADVESARSRLKWDEALSVQMVLALRRSSAAARPAPACPVKPGGILDAFDARLPFTLTDGQQEVGVDIAADLAGTHPMNRLLQGEVGSGKTIVALRAMLQVVDAGRQAALLAPTEVLAAQHARSLTNLLGDLAQAGELGAPEHATRITLLTGSLPAARRKQALLDAASGAAGIVVGTHALIQDKVSFADLGFVVVDEQHRFGVEQRDALRGRANEGVSPHVLVMTATPIPRTVAMTVYGDLETSALRQLPAGRSPISTNVVPMAEKPSWLDRTWQRLREEVEQKGHQAYIVCPRIGEDEAEDDGEPPPDGSDERRPPLAVLEVAPKLAEGALKGLRMGILHGRMPADEKDATMRAFAAAELDVLVATTVIEVGVDVPNASTMVIMDAERFGISQLHQLRGRVGRGKAAGLCLLVTESPDGTIARERLAAVASTVDGFELAQLDLELRREGDILGATQSGKRSTLKLLSLLRDVDVIENARTEARLLADEDPSLSAYPGLAEIVNELMTDERAEYLEKT